MKINLADIKRQNLKCLVDRVEQKGLKKQTKLKSLKVLSFDCALKSLAVCYCDILPKINFKMLSVHNVMDPDSNSDIYNRSIGIKKCLNAIDKQLDGVDIVLIENQMNANDKSRCVMNQIAYHYCDRYEIQIVGPSLKNKIHFTNELQYGNFSGKYMNNYDANKNHSEANFLHLLTNMNLLHLLKDIQKKNYDDIADAVMQIYGWFKYDKEEEKKLRKIKKKLPPNMLKGFKA